MFRGLIRVLMLVLLGNTLLLAGDRYSLSSKPEAYFIYIEPTVDTTSLRYIKTFQADGKKGEDLSSMYQVIRNSAVSAGANCFRLRSFKRNESNGTFSLVLATYQATNLQLHIILNHHKRNTIYIFSDLLFSDQQESFKINGRKTQLKSSNYYKYELKDKEELSVVKGGSLATTALRIRGNTESMPVCYTLSGFKITTSTHPSYYVGFGLMGAIVATEIPTTKIYPIEPDLGLLLKDILTEYKE